MYHNHNNSSIFGTKIQILNDFTFNQTQLFWHSMSEHCSVSHPKLVGTSYIYKKASEKDCREIKIQLSHYSHNCIFMRVGEFLPTQDQVEFDMPSLKNEWMSCFIYTNGLNAVCNHPWLHQHKKCVSSSTK